MGIWNRIFHLFINNNKSLGQIINAIIIIAMAVLIIGILVPALVNLVGPRLTKASALELLENEGYMVLAPHACYPGEFIPCEDSTQSLGSYIKRWKDLWLSSQGIYMGDVTIKNSGTQIDIDGQLVLHDGGKVWLEIQPDLDYAMISSKGAPTLVYYGVNSGFSLPIYYNDKDDDEQLWLSMDVPRVWDGITNPIAHIHLYIPEAGNSGKRCNLQLDWGAFTPHDNDTLPSAATVITQEIICVSDVAYTSYVVQFELIGDMTVCDQLDLRLRRISATENEIVGEVVITHVGIVFLRDKLGELTP